MCSLSDQGPRLGIEALDNDHRRVAFEFDYILGQLESDRYDVDKAYWIDRAVHAFRQHCDFEEIVMEQSAYPALGQHRREHMDLCGMADVLRYYVQNISADDLASRINSFLEAKTQHYRTSDQSLVDFLRGRYVIDSD